jgi:hypothetical protein
MELTLVRRTYFSPCKEERELFGQDIDLQQYEHEFEADTVKGMIMKAISSYCAKILKYTRQKSYSPV